MAAALVATLMSPGVGFGQSSTQPAELYKQAMAREALLRRELEQTPATGDLADAVRARARTLVGTYEDLGRLFPTSGYSDNALWQGATLAADTFWQFGTGEDRTRALRLFEALTSRYPTSSLLKQVPQQVKRLEAAKVPAPPRRAAPPPRPQGAATGPASAAAAPARTGATAGSAAAATPAVGVAQKPTIAATTTARAASTQAVIQSIRREVLADAVRVTIELAQETAFQAERIDGPPRVFIDLQNTRAADRLKDASIAFQDDVVRQVRVGRQLNGRTRVVMDLSGAGRHSVYALYDPFRIVIDFERPGAKGATRDALAAKAEPGASWGPVPPRPATPAAAAVTVTPTPGTIATASPPTSTNPAALGAPGTGAAIAAAPPLPSTPVPVTPTETVAIAPPSTNSSGSFSLSRQLGLGVARIVIDAGHGGRDPGAKAKGLNEAELTLDVALRLEKLLAAQPGVEVVLTRRTDTYVQLEERTALANRAGADLFLSIHANASPNANARGVETYFLNFAPNPEAEAVAARENSGSSKTMRHLPDIVRAIALNNKIDESRDFATAVQASLYDRLRKSNRELKNLGVKQAPFMVLIGATMPSVLAEISFVTNSQEGSLLKTDAYRQQIAEALLAGIMRYQQSLKKAPAIAQQ